jgi:predicted nuclease with TOPRIM domain
LENEKFQELVLQQLSALTEGQRRLETRLDSLETRLDSLESRLDALENGQTRVEFRLENEILPKITALFDGYQLRGDQIENLKLYLDGRLEAIALDINYLIGRVVRHDTAILELKRIK